MEFILKIKNTDIAEMKNIISMLDELNIDWEVSNE